MRRSIEECQSNAHLRSVVDPRRNRPRASAVWDNGKWKVVITRPLQAVDEEEIGIESGQAYATAFTVWSGADSDRGARKSLTKLGQVTLEPSA